jgi:hypothetical protein
MLLLLEPGVLAFLARAAGRRRRGASPAHPAELRCQREPPPPSQNHCE